MQGKVAVLGNADFVMPFAAMGLDTFMVEQEPLTAAETAKKIVKDKYSLVVLAENIAELTSEVFDLTSRQATPCVVVVPFTTESTGFATANLGSLLKAATGINILENN